MAFSVRMKTMTQKDEAIDDKQIARIRRTGAEPALPHNAVSGNEPFLGGTSSLPRMLADLNSKDWRARRRASEQLVHLGEPAIPGLLESLSHHDPDVRSRILRALGALGRKNARSARIIAEAIAPLLKLESNDVVREELARSLARIAEAEPREVNRIRDYLDYATRDVSPTVSQEAMWALRRCGKGGLLRGLMQTLKGQRRRAKHEGTLIDLTGTDPNADLSVMPGQSQASQNHSSD